MSEKGRRVQQEPEDRPLISRQEVGGGSVSTCRSFVVFKHPDSLPMRNARTCLEGCLLSTGCLPVRPRQKVQGLWLQQSVLDLTLISSLSVDLLSTGMHVFLRCQSWYTPPFSSFPVSSIHSSPSLSPSVDQPRACACQASLLPRVVLLICPSILLSVCLTICPPTYLPFCLPAFLPAFFSFLRQGCYV